MQKYAVVSWPLTLPSDAKPQLFVPQKNSWGQRTLTMYEDPIVTEVRKAGQTLAEQAEGDLHIFFQFLREAQKQYQERLVQPPLRPAQAVESGLPDGGALPA
jgi:hypothetical protein